MSSSCVVRVASIGDLPPLLALTGGRTVWSEASVREALQVSAYRFFVVPRGALLVAALWLNVSAPVVDVVDLFVAAPYRQQGVGEALLRCGVQWARRAGHDGAVLEVADDNEAAKALYGKIGFAPVGRRANYYRVGSQAMDALLLRVTFSGSGTAPVTPAPTP